MTLCQIEKKKLYSTAMIRVIFMKWMLISQCIFSNILLNGYWEDCLILHPTVKCCILVQLQKINLWVWKIFLWSHFILTDWSFHNCFIESYHQLQCSKRQGQLNIKEIIFITITLSFSLCLSLLLSLSLTQPVSLVSPHLPTFLLFSAVPVCRGWTLPPLSYYIFP